jgi:5-methyltetrahydrofolate--homocysteine methyltransferase
MSLNNEFVDKEVKMDTKLTDHLAQGKLLIADGATGTMIMAAGLPAGAAPELWNAERPDQVLRLYHAYLDAGSQIILTNTFGGSRLKLAKTGLAERTHELNLAAARLARHAANGQAYVAGDIGPTGELMTPMGSLTDELALEVFSEQAAALAEGGVEALWIETMSDLAEARAAVTAARRVTNLPVFCSLSFGLKARTMMGVTPKQAALELWPLGLTAIGANCGEGLEMIPEVLAQMRQALPEAVLIAKPNAGLPKLVDGKTVYDMEPAQFANRMAEFINQGAQIVGSCCGSSPAYISALVERVGR